MHHIVSDAWSLGVLVREVATISTPPSWKGAPRRFRSCPCSTPISRTGSGTGWLARSWSGSSPSGGGRSGAIRRCSTSPPTARARRYPPSGGAAELPPRAGGLDPSPGAQPRRGGDPVHDAPRRLPGSPRAAIAARRSCWLGVPSPAGTGREIEKLIGFFVNLLVLRAGWRARPAAGSWWGGRRPLRPPRTPTRTCRSRN